MIMNPEVLALKKVGSRVSLTPLPEEFGPGQLRSDALWNIAKPPFGIDGFPASMAQHGILSFDWIYTMELMDIQ